MKLSSILRNSIHFYELANSNYSINKYGQQHNVIKQIDTFLDLLKSDVSENYVKNNIINKIYQSLDSIKFIFQSALSEKIGYNVVDVLLNNLSNELDEYKKEYLEEEKEDQFIEQEEGFKKENFETLSNLIFNIKVENAKLAGGPQNLKNPDNSEIIWFKDKIARKTNNYEDASEDEESSDEESSGEESPFEQISEDYKDIKVEEGYDKKRALLTKEIVDKYYFEQKSFFTDAIKKDLPLKAKELSKEALILLEKIQEKREDINDLRRDLFSISYSERSKNPNDNNEKITRKLLKSDDKFKKIKEEYDKKNYDLGILKFKVFERRKQINNFTFSYEENKKIDELKSSTDERKKIILQEEIKLLELLRSSIRGKNKEIKKRKELIDRLKKDPWPTEDEFDKFYSEIEESSKSKRSSGKASGELRQQRSKSNNPFIRAQYVLARHLLDRQNGDRESIKRELLKNIENMRRSEHTLFSKEIEEIKINKQKLKEKKDKIKKIKDTNELKIEEDNLKIVEENLKKAKESLRSSVNKQLEIFTDIVDKIEKSNSSFIKQYADLKVLRDLMDQIIREYINVFDSLNLDQLSDLIKKLFHVKNLSIELSDRTYKDFKENKVESTIEVLQNVTIETTSFISEVQNTLNESNVEISHDERKIESSFNNDFLFSPSINARMKLLQKINSNKYAFQNIDNKYITDLSNIKEEEMDSEQYAKEYFEKVLDEITISMIARINDIFSKI